MDWLIEVGGSVLGCLLAAGGAVLTWFIRQGLAGWGAAATGVAAILAYRQYRDKRYGLSDGEWDILKALQKFRFNLPLERLDGSDEVEVYLDANEFYAKLNEYPKSCGKQETYGDILLKAHKIGDAHMYPSFPDVMPSNLLVSARYRKYCRSLENREYLSLVGETKSVEKYELTNDGERFIREQWKSIAKRYFLHKFVDEVEIIAADNKFRHNLERSEVVPNFPRHTPSIVLGWEFPSHYYQESNPCGVWFLLMTLEDEVDVEELEEHRNLGYPVRLKVEKPTIHLSPRTDDHLIADLKYFRVSDMRVEMFSRGPRVNRNRMVEMWFGEQEVEQKKIEGTYYRNGYLELPVRDPDREKRITEKKAEFYRRWEWLRHRHENRLSRYRRRLSEAPSRLWSRLRLLAKRDKAD